MKWVCKVCGYVHEGDTAPEECPICFVGPEDFKEIEEGEEYIQTEADISSVSFSIYPYGARCDYFL